jgi:hypothetical protein
MSTISRRSWLKGFGAIAGAGIASRWIGEAKAAPAGKAAVVSIFFEGGFNALFTSADTFVSSNTFGCTSSNTRKVGNGLVVDAGTIGSLGDWALGHMAAIGNAHGLNSHNAAIPANFTDGKGYFPVQLAAAIGGDAAFKAVALGGLPIPGPSAAEGGVSHQLLRTMEDVETALGLGPADPRAATRSGTSKALTHSQAMSDRAIQANPKSLSFAKDAYATDITSLAKPALAIDTAQIAKAYGAASGGNLNNLQTKLAAAELMLRAGSNVITLSDSGWDSHGDRTGTQVRNRMSSSVMPALSTFISRLRSDPDLSAMNVSILLHGEFSRSLPSSDHATVLSALVIGPNVKVGTTGRVTSNVTLPDGTGASREMWSYLAAVAKVAQNPFGTNPHDLIV